MPLTPTPSTAEHLSAKEIARILGRSAPSVAGTLARLGIQPSHTASGGHYRWFPRDAVESVRAAMRKPNGLPAAPKPTPPAGHLPAAGIARLLGRSAEAVRLKLTRLGIRPSHTACGGRFRWYPPDAVERVGAAMRKPNRGKDA